MTMAYIMGLIHNLSNRVGNPFDPMDDTNCYHDYQKGYEDGFDLKMGDTKIASQIIGYRNNNGS